MPEPPHRITGVIQAGLESSVILLTDYGYLNNKHHCKAQGSWNHPKIVDKSSTQKILIAMPPAHTQRYVTAVPVYKTAPSKNETLSLMQLRLLEVQNATLVCPEGLDISYYLNLWPELMVQRYAPEHFVSVQSYNDLVISPVFYESFAQKYEYLLIYQLDAFLLSNQVLEFCNQGYDYYGAPWITGFPQYHFALNRWPIRLNAKRFYVGNGGLSLRKIDSTLNLLKRKEGHISKTFFMEDAFFGYWGSIDPHFHACPPLVAAKFSLEMEPDYWMKKTTSLPMGIHGFEIWHKDFYNSLLQESFQNLYEAYPQLENL